MIKTFGSKETERIFHQEFSRQIERSIQHKALLKLMLIDNAECLDDLKIPPGNRLKPLRGARCGQYSIRINKQYRICFQSRKGDFYQVEMTDDH